MTHTNKQGVTFMIEIQTGGVKPFYVAYREGLRISGSYNLRSLKQNLSDIC